MPVPLRPDYDAARVCLAARESKDASQVRRLLALAAIYDGAARAAAAEIGGVTRQIVRDWVLRFNASGPQGLVDRKAPGQPSRLNDTHRAALAVAIDSGPIPAIHGVVRWRIIDLCQWLWLWDEFQVSISRQTLSCELRALGYRKLSARGGLRRCRPGLPRSALARPGWLAPVGLARGAGQHHHRPAAAQMP